MKLNDIQFNYLLSVYYILDKLRYYEIKIFKREERVACH